MKLTLAGVGGLQLHEREPVPMKVTMQGRGPKGERGDDGWAAPIQDVTASGQTMLDYSAGKTAEIIVEADASFDFTGWPAPVAGQRFLARFTLQVFNPGGFLMNFPDEVKWAGSPPAIFQGLCVLAFTTIDGGATVLGHVVGTDYQ